jgi:hypothetical protein
VLAIQRQVVAELVDQQPGDKAHVGAAALDDAQRCRRAVQGLRVVALDDGPHVLEHDEAARALRQTVADLLADDLVLLGRKALRLGVGHLDGLHRHHGRVEERGVAAVVGEVAAGLAARVRWHGAAGGLLGWHRQHAGIAQPLPQVHLLRVGLWGEALALLAEQLAPEPVELMLQRGDGRSLGLQQPRDVLRRHRGHRLCGEDLWVCSARRHGDILPARAAHANGNSPN